MITIPETLQEVFNIVATHLMSQMKVCKNSDEVCFYRFGELKCAAGALIPDEEYDPLMEGKAWRTMVLVGFAPDRFKGEISVLQIIHDTEDPSKWKDGLSDFADIHGLNKPECLK